MAAPRHRLAASGRWAAVAVAVVAVVWLWHTAGTPVPPAAAEEGAFAPASAVGAAARVEAATDRAFQEAVDAATAASPVAVPTLPQAAAEAGASDGDPSVYACGRVFGPRPLPALEVRVVRVAAGRFEWCDDLRFELRGDGTFAVLGPADDVPASRQFLSVTTAGCAPVAPIHFAYGSRDLELRLVPGGSVTAHLRVDATTRSHPEVLVCELRAAAADSWYEREPTPVADGLEVRFDGLAAATHALRVRLRGDPEALFEVGNLVVHPGREVGDPRLQPIDLRHVRAVRVAVADASGRALDVALSCHPARADRTDEYPTSYEHGVAWVGCRGDLDVVAFALGMRPVRVRGPARDTTVTVEPELLVTVHLDGLPPLPADCRFVAAAGAPPGGTIATLGLEAACDVGVPIRVRGSSFTCTVPEPGPVPFRLLLAAHGAQVEVASTTLWVVQSGEVHWVVDPAAVTAARDRLGR